MEQFIISLVKDYGVTIVCVVLVMWLYIKLKYHEGEFSKHCGACSVDKDKLNLRVDKVDSKINGVVKDINCFNSKLDKLLLTVDILSEPVGMISDIDKKVGVLTERIDWMIRNPNANQ